MSNEIIFKKCDSKLFLEHKSEVSENISLQSKNISIEDTNEDAIVSIRLFVLFKIS